MRFWAKRTFLSYLLLPLAWLFYGIVILRQGFFKIGLKKTTHFKVPVIIIGNITVGGTGKTPLVIWLAELLQKQGWKPGVVSRGYGGKKHFTPFKVTSNSNPIDAGDEPCLIARRIKVPVYICINRVEAVKVLLSETDCNIVIADDGLQHYSLGRNIEIVVVDGKRRFGNGFMLPAGPLREPLTRLQTVDFIAEQGKTFTLQGDTLISMRGVNQIPFTSKKIHAVAGIGDPSRFFSMLQQQGFDIIAHPFSDHYRFSKKDFQFEDDFPIVMTEKDAVKCFAFADQRFWYIPVNAIVEESFHTALLKKIGEPRA